MLSNQTRSSPPATDSPKIVQVTNSMQVTKSLQDNLLPDHSPQNDSVPQHDRSENLQTSRDHSPLGSLQRLRHGSYKSSSYQPEWLSKLYVSLCRETNGRLLSLLIQIEDGVTIVRCDVSTFHLVQLVIHAMKACSKEVPGEHPIRLFIVVGGKPMELSLSCHPDRSIANPDSRPLKPSMQATGLLTKSETKRTPSRGRFSEPIFQTDAFVSPT